MFLTSIGQNGATAASKDLDSDNTEFTKKLLEKAGLSVNQLDEMTKSKPDEEKRLSPDISTPPSGEKEDKEANKGEWD